MIDAIDPPADPELRLVLAYVPARHRAAVAALLALDARQAGLVAAAREPQLALIRLAWWREALERLDTDEPPAEPLLQALRRHALPGGISGAALATMEEGWSILLTADVPVPDRIEAHARFRGAGLFRAGAQLLGGADLGPEAEQAGEGWALADLARRSEQQGSLAAAARDGAAERLERVRPFRWPAPLRPLGQLAALARMDLAGTPLPGSPARLLRLARLRLMGR